MTGKPSETNARGSVGFFWIVKDKVGEDVVLADTIPLTEAEPYGDALTHPGGHYEFWENLRATPSSRWPFRNIPTSLVREEYEVWPRGRVVFNSMQGRFTLYADRRVQTSRLIRLVSEAFDLPAGFFDVVSDQHYR